MSLCAKRAFGISIILLYILLGITEVKGLIHDLKIRKDSRHGFFIENFGFGAKGQLHMTILNFLIDEKPFGEAFENGVAFVIRRTETDSNAFFEDSAMDEDCVPKLFDDAQYHTIIPINSTNNGTFTQETIIIQEGEEGFYNTYFINCLSVSVSFELKLVQYNIDSNGKPNYLSIGYSNLPTVFGVFTTSYFVMLCIWIFAYLRGKGSKVNRVHHLMTVLIVLKLLSLMFKTIEYHFIKTTGSAEGWNVPYYIFAGLKGIMLFVLIALIGSGWSFIKPFLQDREKKIFAVVIPLQILDNIAMIVIEETAPGSQGWFTWKDVFRLVDIICCGAILIPIIWSIKHLREASEIDGKAARNMKKLKLFREFYLMVVSYIYFTRIIVYLVDATLPFRLVWLGDFFTEIATLAFFVVTGYKFRPLPDNPYFSLDSEDNSHDNKIQMSEVK